MNTVVSLFHDRQHTKQQTANRPVSPSQSMSASTTMTSSIATRSTKDERRRRRDEGLTHTDEHLQDELLSESAETQDDPDDETQDDEGSVITWIHWFCTLPVNGDWLFEMPEEWIEDEFNLTGLQKHPHYEAALDMILDLEAEDEAMKMDADPSRMALIEQSARQLYLLLHQRYLLSRQGIQRGIERALRSEFGICPRHGCSNAPVIPVGESDDLGVSAVMLYCGRCHDVYEPGEGKCSALDGAAFGRTFASLLFLVEPRLHFPLSNRSLESSGSKMLMGEEEAEDQVQSRAPHNAAHDYTVYVPKIFGFRIHETGVGGPRASWLRIKPGLMM